MTPFTPAVIAANKKLCEEPIGTSWTYDEDEMLIQAVDRNGKRFVVADLGPYSGEERWATERFIVAAADPDTGFLATTKELERVLAELAKRDELGMPSENWIIKYEDPDKPDLVFTGEGAEIAARLAFGRTGDDWACRLFAEVASTGCGGKR